MWKILGKTLAVTACAGATALILAAFAPAYAQNNQNNTYSSSNISGFNLPGVTMPGGHDEVRAADGTACRSAVSGNGSYLDFGVMGNPNQNTGGTDAAVYGRMVVPLNAPRKRVDCTRIYELEVERLRVELELLKMGLGRDNLMTSSTQAAPQGGQQGQGEKNWDNDGWSNDGIGKKPKQQ